MLSSTHLEGIAMKVNVLFIIATFFLVASINCEAQVRPFLFTISPQDPDIASVNLHFDAGLGDGSLGFSDDPSVDGRIAVEWNLNSRWMFLGNTAFGKDESHTVVTGQIEGFYALRNKTEARFRAAAGAVSDRSSVADPFFGSNRMAIQVTFGRDF
jgi:hypothetical protein